MTDLFAPTLTDLAACARRELAMRENIYPHWVDAGMMSPDAATREIAMMRAIAVRLKRDATHQRESQA